MSNLIVSNKAGAVPTVNDLPTTKVAVNTKDNKQYVNTGSEIEEVAIPVATETTFGGFKYTFNAGVLNLITT